MIPSVSELRLENFRRPIWVFDFDAWRIVDANAAAAAFWGRADREELLAVDFSDLSPATQRRLEAYRRRLAAGEPLEEEEWTFYPPSGPLRARCLTSPVKLENGSVAMLVEAIRLDTAPVEGVLRSLEALRHAGAAVAMFGKDGYLIAANPAAETLLMIREDGNLSLPELFAETSAGERAMAWAAGGAIFNDEVLLRSRLGERWFALRMQPAYDPVTGERAFVVSATDVHSRRVTEQRLSESERARQESERHARELALAQRRATEAEWILREAIDSLDEGFLLVDREDRVVLANRRYAELYPPIAHLLQPRVPFRDIARAFAEQEGAQFDQSIDKWVDWRVRQVREREIHTWEQPLRDGRVFLVSEQQTASGNLVSVRTDITYLKNVEAQLNERATAIEAANDGIAITDKQGNFVYMNVAHARTFDGRPEDFVGKPWQVHFEPRQIAFLTDEVLPKVEAEGSWRGEAVARTLTGKTAFLEISLSRLVTGGLLGVTRDISERKAAETERTRLQQQLFQSQKMESLGRLAGGIAHDFNNILASMLGYAGFLVEDLPDGSEQRRFAEAVVDAGKRAQDLIGQILAFGRAGERASKIVPLREVMRETEQLLRATLSPKIELLVDLGDNKRTTVLGDRSQMIQVLMNLVVNARDAIGDAEGKIVFTLARGRSTWPNFADTVAAQDQLLERAPDGTARLWLGRPPGGQDLIEIRVEDSGCGITPKVMQAMFEPFYTTKKRGRGTGLGLAAVHGLVASHGGAIAVESRLGEGTKFRILLPAAARPGASRPVAKLQGSSGQRAVLVVDDEEGVRSMLATALTRRGFDAVTADSGMAALDLFPHRRIDAVISDQTMPRMTGVQLMKRLHELRPELPVILCTGYSETLDGEGARAAGAAAFLRKPIAPDALIDILDRLLNKRAAEALHSPRKLAPAASQDDRSVTGQKQK
ncbi:response regulator [Algihabitans albus]|uniref:response regulator n=1 Tax=Algihabitans albus TaxID=2164067 RepID=UPI000E5CF493|nr:response regulator [Algihabitans albus]